MFRPTKMLFNEFLLRLRSEKERYADGVLFVERRRFVTGELFFRRSCSCLSWSSLINFHLNHPATANKLETEKLGAKWQGILQTGGNKINIYATGEHELLVTEEYGRILEVWRIFLRNSAS